VYYTTTGCFILYFVLYKTQYIIYNLEHPTKAIGDVRKSIQS